MQFSAQNSLVTAILPCNDLDVSERFYARLGLVRRVDETPSAGMTDTYRMLADGRGAQLHLTDAVEGGSRRVEILSGFTLISRAKPFGCRVCRWDHR